MDESRFPEIVRDLYRVVGQLEVMFPGRPFTPDGHMVGSLGECLAAYYYGLELLPCSFPSHDARAGERLVQVKATQGNVVSIRSEPDQLLVLRLNKDGGFEEVYNGRGCRAWALVSCKELPRNGQYQVRLSALRKLMSAVPVAERLPRAGGHSDRQPPGPPDPSCAAPVVSSQVG